MQETQITHVFPQVNTDPKGTDIPCEAIENATDAQTMLDGRTAKQTIRIEPKPEVVRKAPEHHIFSWSDYGMSRWMRSRLHKAASRLHPPRPARTFGEARSSTC
jgi:hypothetical protein